MARDNFAGENRRAIQSTSDHGGFPGDKRFFSVVSVADVGYEKLLLPRSTKSNGEDGTERLKINMNYYELLGGALRPVGKMIIYDQSLTPDIVLDSAERGLVQLGLVFGSFRISRKMYSV